jgi:class 3 adenylate cyclase
VLVLHRAAFVGSSVDVAKSLTARMPDARLALVEGESVVPFIGDTAAIFDACEGFLGEEAAHAPGGSDHVTRTILYTDLEAHSTMVQRLGDERGREVLREHERLIRHGLREHGGEEVKTFGDGFLASFRSTQQALRCAISLQRAFDVLEPVHGERPRLRVGLNAGEPISENDALYGQAVSVAARIAHSAAGGTILAAGVVRELVAGKGFEFRGHSVDQVPGTDEPVHVFEVEWREAVPG